MNAHPAGPRHAEEIHHGGAPPRPQSAADVKDFEKLTEGVPWHGAVAFGGRNATNLVYWDGKTLHIIEAKGGTSTYGTRVVNNLDGYPPGTRISQTNPHYPEDVARDMMNSPKTDGRNQIGQAIVRAYQDGTVSYVGVRTGSRTDFIDGTSTVTLQDVFLGPGPR